MTRTMLLTVLMALTGCAFPRSTPEPWPVDPDAQMRPREMVVEPAQARPGDVVSVTYAAALDRGILYAIEREGVGGWMRMALMISDGNGGRPSWFRPDDAGVAVEAVGVAGIGPDHIAIPDFVEPGGYRICTANAGDNVCTPIDVVAP
jgi:hypothetical protein